MNDFISFVNPDALLADGYEKALLGYVESFGNAPVALYNRDICISILMERDGMDHSDAIEFFEFNTLGSGMGPHSPAFATFPATDEEKNESS